MHVKDRTAVFKYEVYKMTLRHVNLQSEYKSKLNFWRGLEKRYSDQKQKWLEGNAQMMAAKMAAAQQRAEQEEFNGENIGVESEEDAAAESDTTYEEFSDVDEQAFADPAAQYYTSLDPEAMQRIKDEIASIHLRKDDDTEVQVATRRLLWAANVFVVVLCFACYLFVKMFSGQSMITQFRSGCSGCKQEMDVPLRGLLNLLFPAANDLDEI